ncbi:P1 family peptidase [Actinoplanes sp. NPDC051470]|uniref:P1 family peptidase n=1 Tax=unclassified Actinoplanes TaxID=2626549 RepID=UPI0034301B56
MSQFLSARAGHWTGDGTGVTVILPPPGTVGSGEVRGGAPATREFALLDPTRLVNRVDAVVLSGGSAFGLSAADGVVGALRERGQGFETPVGPVPIVVGLSLFDASAGGAPPTADSGRAAFEAALSDEPLAAGRAGAGTGATTGKWRGRLDAGGIGVAVRSAGSVRVAALIAVNAWGDVIAGGSVPEPPAEPGRGFEMQNTTIGVVLTTAALSKTDCYLLAQSGHAGYARAIHPAHSRFDGDALVALATGESAGPVNLDLLRAVATETVAEAIRAAVTS